MYLWRNNLTFIFLYFCSFLFSFLFSLMPDATTGTGTSWFDTPAQPYSGAICNVFGTRDSCCSSEWVLENVEDGEFFFVFFFFAPWRLGSFLTPFFFCLFFFFVSLWDITNTHTHTHTITDFFALTDLVSPDNTGCSDAIEALRCIVCSPEQATFMSSVEGKWKVDVCFSTSLALYQFCLPEAKKLFPGNYSKDGLLLLNAEGMVQELTTRIMGGRDDANNEDPDKYTPKVNASSEDYEACFLHDTMSPLLKNASYNGTHLHVIFNEPLSVVPVGIHVETDMREFV